MKHIKTFENNDIVIPQSHHFKEYLIFNWKDEGGVLAILRFNKIDYRNDQIMSYLLYSYEDGKLTHYDNNELFVIFFEDVNEILYQSYDLNECLEQIKILSNTKKYNI